MVTPKVAKYIETKATSVGFNVADATLRNGYAGDFMGFQIYISNNLPTGALTALAPANAAGGGCLSGGNASSTNGRSLYFGRKGMIDVAMMRAPAMEIRPLGDRLGSNYITWTVYGSTVVLNNRKRGVNLAMASAYAG